MKKRRANGVKLLYRTVSRRRLGVMSDEVRCARWRTRGVLEVVV
jgi:hypothetical protein